MDIERTFDDNVYTNVDDDSVFPLFVRYSEKCVNFNNKNNAANFDDMVAQIKGVHECCFIHRHQKTKDGKLLDELAVKIDEINFSLTAKVARDGFSLINPLLSEKNIVLPEENEFIKRRCEIKFVDQNDSELRLISGTGSYWLNHITEISDFFTKCLTLPIPPIEIHIEEDKEMWQAYLEGLNALLDAKRDLIKIEKVTKQKNGIVRLDFDMDSYIQNFKEKIEDELQGKCEIEPTVELEDGDCTISFDRYQILPDDTIDAIRSIGKEYCYSAEEHVTNYVHGSLKVLSDSEELASIVANIEQELKNFGSSFEKKGDNEFVASTDREIDFLNRIVENLCKGIAEVRNTTQIHVGLRPSANSFDINLLRADLSFDCKIEPMGNFYILTSHKPLTTQEEIFKALSFVSCKAILKPQHFNPEITIDSATTKNESYCWIFNDITQIQHFNFLYGNVKRNYPDQRVSSVYQYAFRPIIDKKVLADLKYNNYENKSIFVDVPRSSIVLHPKTEEEYNALKTTIQAQLGEDVEAVFPKYSPSASIIFLCDDMEFRKSLFEKVGIGLAENRENFTLYKLKKDATRLDFEFNFTAIEERDRIVAIISNCISGVHGIKLNFENNNDKGVTTWSLTEDKSLKQDLEQKLQSEYREETVNYIDGKEYDSLSKVNEEDFANSHFRSKERMVKSKQKFFLKTQSRRLGKCNRRGLNYALIQLNTETEDGFVSGDFQISKGDYIQFPAMGEAMELLRQSRAMNRILRPATKYNHKPINENLQNFIFDPKYAGETIASISDAVEDIKKNCISKPVPNDRQIEAVAKSVLANDLALIQGPPGTGKTTVIAEIIWQSIRRNPDCKILLTSQTNLAVDNALERLQGQPGIRPIRIGRPEKLEPEGRRFSMPIINTWSAGKDTYVTEDKKEFDTNDNASKIWIDRICTAVSNDPKYSEAVRAWKEELCANDLQSRSNFNQLYKKNVNLVAATCSICGSPDFMRTYCDLFGGTMNDDMFFDVVIMDEASKATPLEMAVPLVLGKKIIVIGDHKQLPPMLDENTIDSSLEKIGQKDLAEKLRKAESQFKRLFKSAAKVRKTIVSTLDTQYRMHEDIMNTIKQFYEEELAATGGLKCGILQSMNDPDLSNKGSRWHGLSLEPIFKPEYHAIWIDVTTPETILNFSYKNEDELKAIDMVLKALQQSEGFDEFMEAQKKPEDKEIGIITFYSAQSREIKKKYKDCDYRMDVVDRFQGMERNIVIVSTVRSNAKNNIGFAKEIERINVAFSRARRLLIVVGNKRQFESNSNYAASIQSMKTFTVEQLRAALR